MAYILWTVTIAMIVWAALEVRSIWVNRRQPIRRDASTNEVWVTPEPRKHYGSRD